MQSDTTLAVVRHLMVSETGPNTAIGSIVYIGCGLASDLACYRAMAPRHIFLIEPNPDLASDLRNLASNDPLLTYLPLAISGSDGQSEISILNHFDLCSLATPTFLQKVYPGAQIEESVTVETITMATLITRIELSQQSPNLLVIEAVGSESKIIPSLMLPEIAMYFDTVVTRLPVHPLFDGSLSPAALIADMAHAHYVNLTSDTCSSSNWASCIFRYSPVLATRDETIARQTKDHHEAIAALQASRDDQFAALKADLVTREETIARQTKDHHEAISVLQAAHDGQLAALKADLATREETIARQQKDSTLALRLRVLHDNDLRDLQGKLQQTERDRLEIEELLRAVTVKLRTAAHYIALLESNPEACIPAALASDLSNEPL